MNNFKGILGAVAACVVGLACAVPVAAHAADEQHNFAVRGIGALQCSAFLKTTGQAAAFERLSMENWILGYLTAENRLVPNTYDIMALQAPEVFPSLVVALCRTYPNASVETVVAGLVQRLEPIKVDRNSPLVTTKSGQNQGVIRQATLVLVEKALAIRTYYRGPIDGEYGPDLQKSLLKFQKDQLLPQTGIPDSATILRLLIELPEGKEVKK